MGCMAFNVSQYGHHLSPFVCLLCIKIPPIHERASLERLFQYVRRFCPSGVADLLFLLLFFRQTQCSWCTPEGKIKNCQIRASVTAGLMDNFHIQTLPVSGFHRALW